MAPQILGMRFRSAPVTLVALASFVLLAACGDDYLVGPGDNCNPEGWVGGHGICGPGYVCSDLDGWTCVPAPSSSYPEPTRPSPRVPADAAACDADAGTVNADSGAAEAAADAGFDREKDAGISGLDGG